MKIIIKRYFYAKTDWRHSQFTVSNQSNIKCMLTFSSASHRQGNASCVGFNKTVFCINWIITSDSNDYKGWKYAGKGCYLKCIWCFFFLNDCTAIVAIQVCCFLFWEILWCIALNSRGLILVHKSCSRVVFLMKFSGEMWQNSCFIDMQFSA